MRKRIVFISFIVGIVILYAVSMIYSHGSFVVDNQYAGDTVKIKELHMYTGGFVMVERVEKEGGKSIERVGFSDYIPKGAYTSVHVPLFADRDRAKYTAWSIFKITLYKDNGDKFFDPKHDIPERDWHGRLVSKYITIL